MFPFVGHFHLVVCMGVCVCFWNCCSHGCFYLLLLFVSVITAVFFVGIYEFVALFIRKGVFICRCVLLLFVGGAFMSVWD